MEESPAVGVTQAMRDELGAIATKAVNALDYENTGTLEFWKIMRVISTSWK